MKNLALILCMALIACNGSQEKSSPQRLSDKDTLESDSIPSKEEKITDERSNWQKPEFVISSLGPLENKTLADIGSGVLGYFVFKILGQTDVEKLIAVDIDKEAVRMLDMLKNALSEEKAAKLDIRLADVNDPKLKEAEVDIILIVNTIAYIPDRFNYLKALKRTLKEDGKIVIVDFKMKRIPEYVDAPPYEERVLLHLIEEELYQAGYTNVYTDDTSLEYQYYISAEN